MDGVGLTMGKGGRVRRDAADLAMHVVAQAEDNIGSRPGELVDIDFDDVVADAIAVKRLDGTEGRRRAAAGIGGGSPFGERGIGLARRKDSFVVGARERNCFRRCSASVSGHYGKNSRRGRARRW